MTDPMEEVLARHRGTAEETKQRPNPTRAKSANAGGA
jgi:hypothetical protein